jgi:hypothetical protein
MIKPAYFCSSITFSFAMKKAFLLLGIVAVLGACKKNDESPATPSSRADLLTAKNWRLATVTATVGGFPLPNNLVLPDCNKDDFFKFNTDKTLIQDAGATKCNSTDPQTQAGTWALNTDESKLTISIPGSLLSGEAVIKELTTSSLHISGTPTYNGVTANVDATFVPN